MTTPVKILFMGDSNTENTSLTNYATQVSENLPALYPQYDFGAYTTGYSVDPFHGIVNHGRSGEATQEYPSRLGYGLMENINSLILAEHAQIIFINLGTNDAIAELGSSDPRISLAQYQANLESAIDQIRAERPRTTIVLMSPIPIVDGAYSGSMTVSNSRTATYAAAVSDIATAKHTRFLDAYNLFWALSGGSQSTFATYTVDGIHLDQGGQDILYSAVIAEIIAILDFVVMPAVFRDGGNIITLRDPQGNIVELF